jgi:hypothetical protein
MLKSLPVMTVCAGRRGRLLDAPLASLAFAAGGLGCDSVSSRSPASASAVMRSGDRAAAGRLDGAYVARLDDRTLRTALAPIKPPLELPGGWWTLTIDTATRRLVLSHPGEGDNTQRIAAGRHVADAARP